MINSHPSGTLRLLKLGLTLALTLTLLGTPAGAWQAGGRLRGQVTDTLGGVVVVATVTLVDGRGRERVVTVDQEGSYTFDRLEPGTYTVRATAAGFAPYENNSIEVVAGRTTVDILLSPALANEELTVNAEGPMGTGSESNASVMVLRGQDLDVLPEDPDDLAASLRTLAGPSAGPDGGEIYVDGFRGARLPSKASIREVRISNNPFNAENEQVGFGRIDVLTRPGMDKFRGSASFSFGDESLNSRNPFAPNRADFQTRLYSFTLSGPLVARRASFFVDFQRREEDENEIINATVIDPSTLGVTSFTRALLTPRRYTSLSPRLDYAINANHTLVARYLMTRTASLNQGVGTFSLPSRAFDAESTEHTVQLTETAVLGPTALNETRLQYIRRRREQRGDSSTPSINVAEAFLGGGSQVGAAQADEDRFEAENNTTITRGSHIFKFGGRLRLARVTDVSPQNFGGTFLFNGGVAPLLDADNRPVLDAAGRPVTALITSIERYRRTVLFGELGFSPARARELGGGATQFLISGGDPMAAVRQVEFGGYVQDEWRLRPNLTLTLGLRYEGQSNIGSSLNFAPRLFIAWAPGGAGTGTIGATGSAEPRTVFRFGSGVYYDRLNEGVTLQANRFDGLTQSRYVVDDPAVLDRAIFTASGVSGVPTLGELKGFALPQTTTRVADDFQAPYTILHGLQIERQLPRGFRAFALLYSYRTKHVLRARNVNAPRPASLGAALAGTRPLPGGDIYQYESSGKYDDYRALLGVRKQFNRNFSLFINYGGGVTRSDVECSFNALGSCFPADSHDLSNEYARVASRPTHSLSVAGTINVPKLQLTLNPMVVASSARYFNITTGRDTNGDGLFTERPALATALSRPEDVRVTPFGAFDLNPASGQATIPRNFGKGPGFFAVNLNLSRAFAFGGAAAGAAPGARPAAGGRPAELRYRLTLSVSVQNLFNHANLSAPVGNLSSPFFGQSTSTVGGYGSRGSAAGNRRVQAQIRFNF